MKEATKKQWMLLIGCMLIQAIPYGLSQNVPPLYIAPLHEVMHFNMSLLGLMFTIGAVFSSIVSPIAGKFFGKKSTRNLSLLGLVIATIGFIIQIFAQDVYAFWIANIFIQCGCIIFSGLAVPYLIGSWFSGSMRPQAMGIAFSGGSIGNFFLQPIFTSLFANAISNNSPQQVHEIFFIIAIAFIIFGFGICLLFVHDNKDDKTPNQTHNEQMKENIQEVKQTGCGFQKTTKIPFYWLMGIGMAIVGLNIAAQSAQYNAFFSGIHLKDVMGASYDFVGSVFAIGCLIGNVMGGYLFSKLGIFKSVCIGFALQLVSAGTMVILSISPIEANTYVTFLPFVWALLYGLSVFMYTSGPSVIIQTLFGMKDFGETVGVFNIFFAVGFALGAFVFSLLLGKADNGILHWSTGWMSVLIYVVVGYLLMLFSIKKVDKMHLDEEK